MWALVIGGVVQQIILAPQDITVGGNHYPAQIFTLWSEAQLNAIGIYKAVYSDAAPTRFHTASTPVGALSGTTVSVTRTWAAPTLAAAKAAAYAIITNARSNACAAGTTISAVAITTDPYSLILMVGYYIAAIQNASFTAVWETTPGNSITLTNAQIKSFVPQILSFLQTQFTTAQTRQAAIAAAATVAAVETALQGFGL